jgi:hypothetical protein
LVWFEWNIDGIGSIRDAAFTLEADPPVEAAVAGDPVSVHAVDREVALAVAGWVQALVASEGCFLLRRGEVGRVQDVI